MIVRNYMSEVPVTIPTDADYREAFNIMQERELHHLPVVDADGKVVGIIAGRDLKLAARIFREAPTEVSEVMHSPVVTVSPDEPLGDATRMMISNRIGSLPVVDGDQIVGIVTETDLLRALTDLLDS